MIGTTYSVAHYEQYNETKDKNLFEEVIDQLMMDNFDPTLQEKIKSLPLKDKRMNILAFLDKDRNLFMKIKSLLSNDVGKMEHIKDVILMLREYVKVGEVEKKKFGEVMTPLELVKEMLATLPEDVWSNPNLKWLDPANGTGPYPMWVIYRLMKGLESWEPNEELRYKHIVENMIYVCELQPKNMFLYMCVTDPKDEYKLNIYTGSFLEKGFDKHMKEVWNVDKFDIVMGNPPYNSNDSGTGNSIWQKFLEKVENICNKYVCFIHPSSWRMPLREGDKYYKASVIIKKYAKEVNILKKERAFSFFNIPIRVDYYLLDFKKSDQFTKIVIDGESKIRNINYISFIPNSDFDTFEKIVSNKDMCEVIYSYTYDPRNKFISKDKSEIFKYTLIHSTPKSGTRYVYSSRNDRGHFGISKIIFGESGINDVIIDINGDYGMTQGAIGIKVSSIEEANNIKNAILSDKFSKFIESVMWSNFRVDWRIFTNLKKDFWKEFIS